jgi:hypothetical protein
MILRNTERAAVTDTPAAGVQPSAGAGAADRSPWKLVQLRQRSCSSNSSAKTSTCRSRSRPDLHPVEADPVQIQQVLMNLAINAATPCPRADGCASAAGTDRGPVLRERHRRCQPGDYVLLEVSGHRTRDGRRYQGSRLRAVLHTKDPVRAGGLGLARRLRHRQAERGLHLDRQRPRPWTSISLYLPPPTRSR